MHIPDGYLSPIFALGTGVVAIPCWGIAAQRVRKVLDHQTVPLLAVFSAFSFAVMMFNVPVPGGTTAHAVGGTLAAVVLGPWAASICVSIALIIQALFFGDGGIVAVFANCFAIGVVSPFTGYFVYRLIAGNSPALSTRRVWAAGIGAYVGITASALVVALMLGVQPLLFSEGGRPLYSPYGLEVTLPAMLISHLIGAALIEGVVTALGLAYIQQYFPRYLTALKEKIAGPGITEGEPRKVPYWGIAAATTSLLLILLFLIGLLDAGGDITHLFRVDWSQVNWTDVGLMLAYVALVAIILIPLAWFLLPRAIKKVGTAFLAIAIIAPLGLITPGFAFAEGSPEDIEAEFNYIPEGLQQTAGFFSAPLPDYTIPFVSDESSPLWHIAIGYELSGIIGFLLLGVIALGIGWLLRRRQADPEPAPSSS